MHQLMMTTTRDLGHGGVVYSRQLSVCRLGWRVAFIRRGQKLTAYG